MGQMARPMMANGKQDDVMEKARWSTAQVNGTMENGCVVNAQARAPLNTVLDDSTKASGFRINHTVMGPYWSLMEATTKASLFKAPSKAVARCSIKMGASMPGSGAMANPMAPVDMRRPWVLYS